MSEDIEQLTTTTLSFLLMILNGTLTAISFSGVLWAISPKLFLIAVLYAAAGSAMTILLGRPLIRLNYRQSDVEADFRCGTDPVREKCRRDRADGQRKQDPGAADGPAGSAGGEFWPHHPRKPESQLFHQWL